ncbi:nicotinamide riboside transporter PnuC [Brevibacillus daliensis]|uniref:nicotinamide riboside transporter PnuC n=1 Tax=Brevibacillus daliensis TaxID=2892995 RepID=UPI001E6538C1|nr:nicotinamide riboside transporter PnuC [Brevibacillus daliensis]
MVKHPLFLLIASVLCLAVGLYLESSYLEIFASVIGIANVWLLAREKVLNFIFGIIAVACFLIIFMQQGLYAMSILSVIQIGFNVYGWYYWLQSKGEADVRPTVRLSVPGWIKYLVAIVILWALWAYYQVTYTDASRPYIDAFNAVIGLVAQFMLSKKILENWHLWILANVLSIIIYLQTGLYVMIILAAINLCLCIQGLIEWKRNYDALGSRKRIV